MSRVVLRCPNCGTTQAGPGECETCHEAPVAYYCTNHSPGRWLEAPACPQCGARFGEASPVARKAPPPATRPTSVAASRQPTREPGPSSLWTRSAPRPEPSGPALPPATSPLPPLVREEPRAAEREAMTRRLRDVLMRGTAAGRYGEVRGPETDIPPPRNAMIGLIRRLLVLAFLFVAAMFLLSLFTGGPLLQILLSILLSS